MRFLQLASLAAALLPLAPAALAQPTVYEYPTERYGVAWGATPEAVADRFDRPPDSAEPAGTVAYVGRSGGQAMFVFERDGDGVERLAVAVDSTPLFADAETADAEHARYRAALVALLGEPAVDGAPRDDDSGVTGTVWRPSGEVRSVELTRDTARVDGMDRPFFYVRVVGPAVGV